MRTIRRRRGFTLIELLIVITIIMAIVSIAVVQGNKVIMSSHETAAISEIKTIHNAQVQYYSQFGKYATSLAQLGPPISGADGPEAANILPQSLASGKKSGYVYTVSGTATGYTVSAVPESFGGSGRRTFYSDQNLVIRNNWGAEPATPASPEIGQ